MNSVNIMGRLTRDVEIRYSQGVEPIAIVRFSIAINRRYNTGDEPKADFINCIALGKTAEFISKYFTKGKMIAISGEIRTNNWTDQNGQKRYSTEVFCEKVSFCGDSKESTNTTNENNDTNDDNAEDSDYYHIEDAPDDDNLPF